MLAISGCGRGFGIGTCTYGRVLLCRMEFYCQKLMDLDTVELPEHGLRGPKVRL